jgi:hypothetical protein
VSYRNLCKEKRQKPFNIFRKQRRCRDRPRSDTPAAAVLEKVSNIAFDARETPNGALNNSTERASTGIPEGIPGI